MVASDIVLEGVDVDIEVIEHRCTMCVLSLLMAVRYRRAQRSKSSLCSPWQKLDQRTAAKEAIGAPQTSNRACFRTVITNSIFFYSQAALNLAPMTLPSLQQVARSNQTYYTTALLRLTIQARRLKQGLKDVRVVCAVCITKAPKSRIS